MGDATAFDVVSARLEELTSLDRLEARGTLRIALKTAGFDARSITSHPLRVVIDRVLADLLLQRGVDDVQEVCRQLASSVPAKRPGPVGDAPEAIFARLANG